MSAAERLRRLATRFPQPVLALDTQLAALVARSERWLRGFPRGLAIRAAAQRGVTEGVAEWIASNDRFVHQTATWAITPEKDRPAMLLIEKVIMLKTVPMFARTSEELLGEIAALFEEVEVRAGEPIFAKGDVGESMYIVISGHVRVFDGNTEPACSAKRKSSASSHCSIRSLGGVGQRD